MKKKIIILSVCLLFITSLTMAGTAGKIAGKIFDAQSGDPLPGANVFVQGTSLGAATDIEGDYFILNVPPGIFTVTVKFMGYAEHSKTEVRVFMDQTTTLDFSLSVEVIQGEIVTIVAERPVVEKDLTASKERISGDEITKSWTNNIEEAIMTLSGVNINGGIRGGFGLDVKYTVDGFELRDEGSNSNFTAINTSAIEEMEILLGGYNAEYGQASGAIVNIVTKSSTSKHHGSVRYRMRPSGVYHWGRQIYSKDNYEWKIMGQLAYWDPSQTYSDLDGTVKPGHDGGSNWADNTPQERLAQWEKIISGRLYGGEYMQDYDKRTQSEVEGTLYGPITNKLGYMISGRYLKGVEIFPSYLKNSPEITAQAKLRYDLSPETRLQITGILQDFENGGASKTTYYSGGENGWTAGSQGGASWYNTAYNRYKHWQFGTGFIFALPRAPEYGTLLGGQLKFTHTFSPRTFIEVVASHKQIHVEQTNNEQVNDSGFGIPEGGTYFGDNWTEADIPENPIVQLPEVTHRTDPRLWLLDARTQSTDIKVDLVSQVTKIHQLKTGAFFSYMMYDHKYHGGFTGMLYNNELLPTKYNPYEGGMYLQDKFETKGMIINVGLRFDFFSLNKKVSQDIFDPGGIAPYTPGNEGMGIVSFDPDGPYAVKPKTRTAVSPRIGISHPITENSVLHFMYGHFNQRPAWQSMGGNPNFFTHTPWDQNPQIPDPYPIDPNSESFYITNINSSNPALTYERTIQYEIGWEQNIRDLFRMDVTMFYKDVKNSNTLGGAVVAHLWSNQENAGAFFGNVGRFWVPHNGGWMDSRGLEATLESRFMKHVKFRLAYNLSYSISGSTGSNNVFKEFEDGTKNGIDTRFGVSLRDKGVYGNTNEGWNPHNTFKLTANISSPNDFGPVLGSYHPLGDWYLNVYSTYASGPKYTYHSPGDLSTEPLNQQWEPYKLTNIRIAKGIKLPGKMRLELRVDIINLFNSKRLRMLGGDDLRLYKEGGILPVHPQTGENLEWTWYADLPRQIFYELSLEF